MSLFVDTSVWSLAFRRDLPSDAPEVRMLVQAIKGGETLIITGPVLQELLQGFSGEGPAVSFWTDFRLSRC